MQLISWTRKNINKNNITTLGGGEEKIYVVVLM
jgi:hypothetical protein